MIVFKLKISKHLKSFFPLTNCKDTQQILFVSFLLLPFTGHKDNDLAINTPNV